MPYLMHIGFDNSHRLSRNVYYFEYKGIRYKLIQNNVRQWSDVLLTIVNDINDRISQDMAFMTAAEFLSALSWENGALIKLREIGGPGVSQGYTLKKAQCSSFGLPRVPFSGYIVGNSIIRIPKIETEEQQLALSLFREALSSNNEELSFLFYWHILEVAGTKPIGWIDKTYRHRGQNRLYIPQENIKLLQIGNKSIGYYLYDDCRNAIAHIMRKPKKKTLKLDVPEERRRIILSTRVIKEFAKFYIINELQLKRKMYLVRKNGVGFPVYMDQDYSEKHYCTIVLEPRQGIIAGKHKNKYYYRRRRKVDIEVGRG